MLVRRTLDFPIAGAMASLTESETREGKQEGAVSTASIALAVQYQVSLEWLSFCESTIPALQSSDQRYRFLVPCFAVVQVAANALPLRKTEWSVVVQLQGLHIRSRYDRMINSGPVPRGMLCPAERRYKCYRRTVPPTSTNLEVNLTVAIPCQTVITCHVHPSHHSHI